MAPRRAVRWSPAALRSLEIYLNRYSHFGGDPARRRLLGRIDRAVRRLPEFPESGRVLQDFEASRFRELVVPPFRIIYELTPGSIEIAGVLRSEQDFSRN